MTTLKNLKAQARIWLGVLAVGLVLMAYMITVESEPGALPLLLVLGRLVGYCVSRYRIGKHGTSR